MPHSLSLRLKILLLVVGLLIGLGAAVAFYLQTTFTTRLTDELLKRGVSISKHLAESGTSALLFEDRLELTGLARVSQATEPDIVYVVFLDASGQQVLAHSFSELFPSDLLRVNRLARGADSQVVKLDTGREIVYDIAVPVQKARAGIVRIGISAQAVGRGVAEMVRQILTVTLILILLASLLAIPLTHALIRPIRELTNAAESLSHGLRVQPLDVVGQDELGVLTEAFNRMVINLAEAKTRLAGQLRFMESLLADLPEPVFYQNLDGQLLGCNRSFEEFFGVTEKNITDLRCTGYFPAAEAEQHLVADREVMAGAKQVCYELQTCRADGSKRETIIHKVPFTDAAGEMAGLIGVIQDVTLERETSRLKSEFVSTVAHEFQTPLASIIGFSELLLGDEPFSKDERQEFNQLIYEKGLFLSKLVDELLDLSRLETGQSIPLHKEKCPISEMVAKTVDTFRRRLPDFDFKLELPEQGLTVMADRERLGQVLDNVISNAVKYSGEARQVHLSMERVHEGCQIRVRDEGIGMSADQIGQVTEKFYRVDASETAPGGTGLGMFIVKSIIDAHGGSLQIDSEPASGTTIGFTLPIA